MQTFHDNSVMSPCWHNTESNNPADSKSCQRLVLKKLDRGVGGSGELYPNFLGCLEFFLLCKAPNMLWQKLHVNALYSQCIICSFVKWVDTASCTQQRSVAQWQAFSLSRKGTLSPFCYTVDLLVLEGHFSWFCVIYLNFCRHIVHFTCN